ncbi:MAG: hypothetical protein HYY16_02160 [Planctomycetes bacterium]|nr:hypothetical protein [Planctomycetota bacterium]
MTRGLVRWAVLLAGLTGCRGLAVPEEDDPYAVPYALLSEEQRRRVAQVMDDPTCEVEFEPALVRSRPDVYRFLMNELPFAAGVLRELGESKYEISRDGRGVYRFDDHEGLTLRAELLRQEEQRWIWYTTGTYGLGLLGAVDGRSVVIVRCEERGSLLRTEARVYAKVDGVVLERAAKAAGTMLEGIIREKSSAFVKAARLVSEITARNAEELYTTVRGSAHVDAETLEEYRRRFVR